MAGMSMALTPMQVEDVAPQQESVGHAQDKGLSAQQFLNYCLDIQRQPSWRQEADKCVDYYDGNQLDASTMAALEAKGMGPLITNIISPIVNVVLGMEAKTRSDFRVGADSDEWQDVAEALSAKLFEAERETRADRASSDGYAGQIKAGLGWVEVGRNANPFQYRYRAGFVHRRELFWDWRDLTHDLRGARYQVRKRWYDVDQASAFFPKWKTLFEAAVGDSLKYYLQTMQSSLTLSNAFDQNRGLDFDDYENWRSIERRRVCLYECWYRQWVRGYVLRLPNQDVVELNMQNPVHVVLLSRGAVRPEMAVYSKMRSSIWAGPIKLTDCAAKNDYSPYVPFWGYREDRTGVPYGLIRAMLSPQDEVNARRRKLLWILGAKRLEMDSDALDQNSNTLATVLQEIGRPDAVVILNKDRVNKQGGFKVETEFALGEQQYEIMKDSEEAAQRVVGVFNALLGRDAKGSANSGVAIQSLVEQGTTALAEINDNYRYGRRLVGERLLNEVRDDLIGQQVTVMAGEQGRRKTISLNQPAQHPETGLEIIANDVAAAKVKVALEDVPSTPHYRQQQFTMLAELTKGLPPELQAAVTPFIIEASELQKRRQIADTMRKTMGVQEPRTPEEAKQLQQQQEEQAAIQRRSIMAEIGEREAKMNKMNAEAEKVRAEIKSNPELSGAKAEYEKRIAELEATARQDVDKLTADLVQTRTDAQFREQELKRDLSIVQQDLKHNASDRDSAAREASIKLDIAKIEKDKEIRVAEITADAEKVVAGLTDQIAKLRDEMRKAVEDARKAGEAAAESAAAEAEKRIRDEQKVAERARKDAEREAQAAAKDTERKQAEKDKASAKEEKSEPAQAGAPITLNLDVTIEGSTGKSTFELVKTDKGYSGTKTSEPKKK